MVAPTPTFSNPIPQILPCITTFFNILAAENGWRGVSLPEIGMYGQSSELESALRGDCGG